MRASSSTPRRSRATRASSPRASSSRCCMGCGATCSSGCGARDTTCACTSRSAPSGIPISCAGSPSGRRTWCSSSATCCGSPYGGADGRYPGRVPASARARPRVLRERRPVLLGGDIRGRCPGCPGPVWCGAVVRTLVRRGRSSGRPPRDGLPVPGRDARRRTHPPARPDVAGGEAASRRVHPSAGTRVTTTGVVLVRTGSAYRVHTDRGEVTAVLRGKLKHRDDDRVVAGDVVELELQADGHATIFAVRPRRSVLARRAAGERSPRAQPIAANVDQVVVVASARSPEPSPRMLDRFLVIAAANRIPAVLVLNKIDVDRSALDALQRRYGPEGLVALRDLLRGRESVLAVQSGVGKSSLLNALDPGLNLRIGAISAKWDTGKHTTRAALVVPVATGGYVVDTPGLRELGTWGIDPERLGVYFAEFQPFLDECRFDNCRHLVEPGCGVRQAAERGAFDPDRLVSYQRIYEEVSVPSWSSDRRRGR